MLLQVVGIGSCDRFHSDRVTVVVSIIWHLYFRAAGWANERGLYPPSSWS
jgi:hypothetical protein